MSLSFLTFEDSYPFKLNMEQFADEYKFNIKDSYDDENKVTPKFCMYNREKHVYLDDKMLDTLASVHQVEGQSLSDNKKELIQYIKDHFEIGLDRDDTSSLLEEEKKEESKSVKKNGKEID